MVDHDESFHLPPEDSIQFEHCFTISDTQPYSANATAAALPSLQHRTPDKGHFILLDLASPDSDLTTQIPFQIDLAASCNTLPSNLLSSMPWAKLAPTKTVIIPYTHQSSPLAKSPSKLVKATPLAISHSKSSTLASRPYSA